jgi:hypothetical protein
MTTFPGSMSLTTPDACLLQTLLSMAVLLYSSVYMLLCWVVLVPLACELTLHINHKQRQLPGSTVTPLAVGLLGAGG